MTDAAARMTRSVLTAVVAATTFVALPAAAPAETLGCQVSAGGFFDPPMRDLSSRSGATSGTYVAETGGLVNRSECFSQRWAGLFHTRFTTRGTFSSTRCGTGVLTGDPTEDATRIETTPLVSELVGRMSYTIELREWQGILRVTEVNGVPEQGGDDVDGIVTLVPQHACVESGVETFTIDGWLLLAW